MIFLFLIIFCTIILIGNKSSFGAKFVGNKSLKVLHYRTCDYAKEIRFKNKVSFRSLKTGLKKGYSVCDRCIDDKKK